MTANFHSGKCSPSKIEANDKVILQPYIYMYNFSAIFIHGASSLLKYFNFCSEDSMCFFILCLIKIVMKMSKFTKCSDEKDHFFILMCVAPRDKI